MVWFRVCADSYRQRKGKWNGAAARCAIAVSLVFAPPSELGGSVSCLKHPRLLPGLRRRGSPEDAQTLKALGVAAVYTPKDFQLNDIMADIVQLVDGQAEAA